MTEVAISGADGSPERLTSLLERGDPAAVADFFEGMGEVERQAFVKPLRAHLKAVSWKSFHDNPARVDSEEFHRWRASAYQTQVPAALAVLSGSVTVAKYLRSVQREVDVSSFHPDAVRKVLTDRSPDWLPELADALADILDAHRCWELVNTAATVAGVVPAASPAFVRAWTRTYQSHKSSPKFELADDPRVAELLPLTFDDEENDHLYTDSGGFRAAALETVARGSVGRAEMLDAGLRRLLRGGRIWAMQSHLAFWNALKPTDEEVAERISSCVRLLSAKNGTVAKAFLVSVKKVCDAGIAGPEFALEAASIAVKRSEKNVVKAALGWLDALAAADPERGAEIVEIMTVAFGALAADVQQRAVELIGKRAKALGQEERQRLVAEVGIRLPPDLASTLAGLLGAEQQAAMADVGYPDLAPYVPRPLLPAIESPAELARVLRSFLYRGVPAEAMVFERVLEAFVVFSRTDAFALREALAPMANGGRPMLGMWWSPQQTPRKALFLLVEIAVEPKWHPHRVGVHQLWERVRALDTKRKQHWTGMSPADFLILRTAEIQAALGLPDLPPLVSVPTAATGIIDPGALAARLRECESKGWVPLEADFHQALLRLPTDCGGVDTTGFTSDAGRRFAAWVAGDRVEVPAIRLPVPGEIPRPGFRTAPAYDALPKTLLELVPEAWTEVERQPDRSDWDVCWPAILPAHPDLPALAVVGGGAWWSAVDLSAESAILLAELDDPVHAGTHYVIAARLLHEQAAMSASGIDATMALAARKLLDPRRLAAALAARLPVTTSGMRILVPRLRDLAEGGAAGQAWETIAALLPEILPPAFPRMMAGTADLLALGSELARALTVREPIAEVTALAEKKGGGVAADAARRLAGVLAG